LAFDVGTIATVVIILIKDICYLSIILLSRLG
jgi:hypothetical protein